MKKVLALAGVLEYYLEQRIEIDKDGVLQMKSRRQDRMWDRMTFGFIFSSRSVL